ncbi:MAG TPA: AEC family transporter [Xanthobacteraceae bacterium]|jgi:predicted permease|nr:AEC family transporter [Xanthobacteraceae bacterium]
MNIVANALLPVFLIIALGAVLRRTLLPNEEMWNPIERLTYYVLFPALLIVTTGTADLSDIPVRDMAIALIVPFAAAAVLLLLARNWLIGHFALSGASYTSIFQASTRWSSYISLAIAAALYNAYGLALTSVALIALVPLFNALNVWVLARYVSDEKVDFGTTLLHIVRNPLIWSCLVGIAINLSGLPLPKFSIAFAEILGRASLAVGLLLVGAGLELGNLWKINTAMLIPTVLKLALIPLCAIGLAKALGLQGPPLAIVTLITSVPTAPAGYVLARQMGGDAPLYARIITFQTILGFVTVTLALMAAGIQQL